MLNDKWEEIQGFLTFFQTASAIDKGKDASHEIHQMLAGYLKHVRDSMDFIQ